MSDEDAGDSVIDEIWAGDVLDRQADARIVVDFLTGRMAERKEAGETASYVLNIDAGWGQGKTFFLERLQRQLAHEGHAVAYCNAWRDDHADDPLVGMMASIEAAFRSSKLKKAQRTALETFKQVGGRTAVVLGKSGLRQLALKAIGENGLVEVSEAVETVVEDGIGAALDAEAKRLLSRFDEGSKAITQFRESIAQLVIKRDGDGFLFVLVDELDRCRPPYAIAMLERAKHLFDVDGVVFIVATDTGQLRHAIGSVYGAEFDCIGYLKRFFNRTYRFATTPPIDVFVASLFDRHPVDADVLSVPPKETPESVFTGLARTFELSLRDIEQCYDVFRSVVTLWPSQRPEASNPHHALKLETIYVVMLIAMQHKYADQFEAFMLGESGSLGNLPTRKCYALSFDQFDERQKFYHGEAKQDRVDVMDFIGTYVGESRNGLANIVRQNRSDGRHGWIRDRFSEEFAWVHRNQHNRSGDEPKSFVLRYPELVRTAGQLSA